MINYNSQVTEGDYRIQFETDDKESYQKVRDLIRELIDREDERKYLSSVLKDVEEVELKSSKAFAIANNAIYFDDSSDYLSALYEVCNELNFDSEYEPGKEYIEED